MPLPALAAAAIAAAPAIGSAAYKIFAGGKQVKDGKRIEKNNKFINYERPGEVKDALALTERNYLNGMPGSDTYENRIGTSAAMAMDSATQGASSSGDVLDAATKISQNTNNALLDLGVQEDQFKQNALGAYTGQLNNNAQYADKEFNYNIAQPYQRKAAAASALIGAGNQNIFTGLDEGLGVATDALRTGLVPREPNMGEIMGNKGFANPALMGRWIVDPATGSKRWAAN